MTEIRYGEDAHGDREAMIEGCFWPDAPCVGHEPAGTMPTVDGIRGHRIITPEEDAQLRRWAENYRSGPADMPTLALRDALEPPKTPHMFHGKPEQLTDGFHTMEELYDHRRALTAALAVVMSSYMPGSAWRSKQHHPDGDPMFDGYFIVGINLPTGPITYHYKLKHWDDFRYILTLTYAPKWDGASPADSVDRLLRAARDDKELL